MRYGRIVVERVLDELGIDFEESESSPWAAALCPLHDDTSPSFTIHIEDGGWKCHSGCGSGGDLAYLVEAITGEDARDARRRMQRGLPAGDKELAAAINLPVEQTASGKLPEPIVDLTYELGKYPKYLKRRGFTRDTLAAWEVGWDADLEAVVIPVTDEGRIVGLVRRPLKPIPGKGKYLNSKGLTKGDALLGLDNIPFGAREVTLVEGPLDAIWLFQEGYPAVASLGASLSGAQAEKLTRRFWTVWLAYDPDTAGRTGMRKAARLLGRVRLLELRIPAERADVQECTAEELKEAFSHRIPFGIEH